LSNRTIGLHVINHKLKYDKFIGFYINVINVFTIIYTYIRCNIINLFLQQYVKIKLKLESIHKQNLSNPTI